MLSSRGRRNADQLDIPWRFAMGTTYDPGTNPDGMISFATAENALVQEELQEFANKVHIPGTAFRYVYCTNGGSRLPAAFASHINDHFKPFMKIEADDIKVTSAATALHDVLAYSLCMPGEAILTSKPYYGRFELDFGNKAGVRCLSVDTDHEDCFKKTVVEVFEKKLQECEALHRPVRAILIVNPHNPLGRCYPRETLLALLRLCAKYRVHLISDEIYALSTWTNPEYPEADPFTSILAIDTSDMIDPDLVHATYGLSKDFGSAGLKIGALISKNKILKKAVHAVLRFHGVSGPAVAIGTAMLDDKIWCGRFIDLSRRRIASAYTCATDHLKRLSIPYFAGGNAGFFLWLDLSTYLPSGSAGSDTFTREQVLGRKLVDHGLFLHAGEEHAIRPGWFRMVFTVEEQLLAEGFRRLEKALKLSKTPERTCRLDLS